MKLDGKIETWFLLLFLFANGVPFVEGNLSTSRQTNDIQNQVYFPALPDVIIEEFGFASHGRSENDVIPKVQTPVVRISHRPLPREQSKTTGTLPLAKKSHVVDNSVTEAPGPSYLTESAYYHEESHVHTTPRPIIGETKLDHRVSEGFHGEFKRIFLPPRQEKSKGITLDLAENPAYLYYIPVKSEILSPGSPPPKPIDSIVAAHTPITHKNQPKTTTILTTFHSAKTTHKPVSPLSQLPSSTSTIVNSKPPNAVSAQGSHRLSPAPSRKLTSVPPSRLEIKSKGYLPKPAPNPFAPRFPKQVLKSETQPKLVLASSTSSLPERTLIPVNQERTTIASVSLRDSHLEKRKQPHTEESPRSSLSGNKEETYNRFLRHFGFNFNSAAINTIKQKRKAVLIKDIPKEQKEPIRRASTDFFLVPSLFRGRNSTPRSAKLEFALAGNSHS